MPWKFLRESFAGDEKLKEQIFQRILNATEKLNKRLSYDNCLILYNLNNQKTNPNKHNFYAKVVGNFSFFPACLAKEGLSHINIFENTIMNYSGEEGTYAELRGSMYGLNGSVPANM